jgi:hypothetical protein
MRLLRTLPMRRLLPRLAVVVVLAVVLATVAVQVARSGGSTPQPKPLGQALHDAVSAAHPDGLTARIKFTNRLLPTGALPGELGSALLSGASGRLWVTNDGRGRVELQSNAGDVQVVWNQRRVTVFDASSNTVYRADLPARATERHADNGGTPPSVVQIERFLSALGKHAELSAAEPANVAGREAYSVRVSPRDTSSLLGGAQLAWDAARGVPLRIGIYAKGSSKPVLELAATEITFGSVPASAVEISPPAGARPLDLTLPERTGRGKREARDSTGTAIAGLPAVRAAAGFPVTAPDALAGRQRQHIRLVGDGDSQAAVAVYGRNLGAIVVVERKAGPGGAKGPLGSLPTVSLDGVTAHELATPLLTALEWNGGGVEYVLAGSVTPHVAEAAARDLG